MTNEEAIREIESYMPKDEPMNAKDREAFFLAIEALKGTAVRRLIKDKIDILEDRASTENNEGRWVEDEKCRYAIEVLEEILEDIADKLPPVAPKPSWIHVSEDLPKESGEYLVSVIDEYDGNYEAVGVAQYDAEEGKWQDLGVDRTVIAWNHKPAPYKEEGE